MFETLFEIVSAWNALLYLTAGATVSGFGLLIVGYTVYVRVTERRYQGQIVDVRTQSPGQAMYWPTIAYTDEAGERQQVLANSGSSSIGGRTPGTKVTIFADAAAPSAVLLARDWWLLFVICLVVSAVGAPFIAAGVSALHVNWATGVAALGLAGYIGVKLFRFLHPLLDARKAGGWEKAREAFAARMAQRLTMQPVADAEIATVAATQRKNNAKALPVLAAAGAAVLIGGGFWLRQEIVFLQSALIAEGVVLRNVSDDSGSSPAYHAVVAFTDRNGNRVTYRDGVGSSPPLFSSGDGVKVYYAPGDSQRAAIDRGMWNWLVPLLVALGGGLLLGLGAYGLYTRRPSLVSGGAASPSPAAAARQP